MLGDFRLKSLKVAERREKNLEIKFYDGNQVEDKIVGIG